MVRNTHWRGIGTVSAVLIGIVVAGCSNQKSNPDNISGAPVTAANTTGSGTSATASAKSFDDAANTWSRVEEARAEMDTAMEAKQLDQVHESTSKIRDLVKTLPDKSAMLPEDKRKDLDAHVRNVGELAAMMDKSDDPNDMKSAQEHQTAMHESLDMMKGMYPAGTMHASMHMPNMNSSSKTMPDDNMPGKGMSGMGDKMGGMGGKMKGMGKKPDPGKQADPNGKPMPGGGMGGDM
jgi:hypothetical protein